MGGGLTKIVTFETKHFVRYSRRVRNLGRSLLGGFTVFQKQPKKDTLAKLRWRLSGVLIANFEKNYIFS